MIKLETFLINKMSFIVPFQTKFSNFIKDDTQKVFIGYMMDVPTADHCLYEKDQKIEGWSIIKDIGNTHIIIYDSTKWFPMSIFLGIIDDFIKGKQLSAETEKIFECVRNLEYFLKQKFSKYSPNEIGLNNVFDEKCIVYIN